MSIDVGTISVKIGLDGSQFDKDMAKVGQTIKNVGKSVAAVGKSLTMKVTAPIAAMAAVSVKAFGDFDDAMTKSLAIMTGVTPQLREEMKATARTMSTETTTSAKKLAESYFFLASAGLDAEKSLMSLDAVNTFAIAGTFDMAIATDLLTDAQSALGLSSKDATVHLKNMTRVSDVLTKANTLANATVLQFSKALTTKAAAALRDLNKDIEEGVAVLAAFADQGKKGERAGESLMMALRDLQRAAIRNEGAWKSMGLSIFDANEKMLPLADIIGQLSTRFDGMTDKGQKTAAMLLGFQERSFSALQTLFGTSEQIREYEKALRKAGGTTQRVADENMSSFNAQMKIFKNQIVDVAIDIGQVLAPMIKRLTDRMKEGIKWWKDLNQEHKELIVKLALFAAAAGPVLIVLGTLITMAGALIAAIATLKVAAATVFAALSGSAGMAVLAFIALVATIAAVVVAVKVAVDAMWGPGSFGQAIANVWNAFKTMGSNIVGFFSNFRQNMTALWKWWKENWEKIIFAIPQALSNAGDDMVHNIVVVQATMLRLWAAFYGWFTAKTQDVFSIDFVNSVLAAQRKTLAMFLTWGSKVSAIAVAALSGPLGWAKILKEWKGMGLDLVSDFKDGAGKGLAKTAGEILKDQVGKLQNTVGDAFKGIEGPKLNLTPFWEDPGGTAKQVKKMTDGLEEVKEGVMGLSLAFENMDAGIMQGIAMAKAAADQIKLQKVTAKTIERMQEWEGVWDSIGESIGNAFETAVFEAQSARDTIKALVEDISRIVFQQMVTNQIAKAITSGLSSFTGTAPATTTPAGSAPSPDKKLANGGVFNRPISFGMGGGKTGLMAERGPEAIVPLERDSTGKLGLSGGQRITVIQNIETPDPGSFKRSEKQIARKIRGSIGG